MNTTERVSWRGGWIGLFTGESQGKAFDRAIDALNEDGYRFVFAVPDKFSLVKRVVVLLLAVATLGIVVIHENYLIIAEELPQTRKRRDVVMTSDK